MTSANYTREEEARLLQALRGGHVPPCPRCGERFAEQRVPPKEGFVYVRDRVWLTCEGCHRSVVLDRKRIDQDV